MWTIALGMLKNLSPKMIGMAVAGLAVVGLGLYVWILSGRVDRLELEVLVAESQTVTCQLVNDDNQDAIRVLRGANESLRKAVVVNTDVRVAAAIKAKERQLEAEYRVSEATSELEDLRNADPSCEELSRIDIGAVCPLVVERMREYADAANRQD